MPRYLVECHLGGRNLAELVLAHGPRSAEVGVTWLHGYVSDDGATLYALYEAPGPETVRAALARDRVVIERIVRVYGLDPSGWRGPEQNRAALLDLGTSSRGSEPPVRSRPVVSALSGLMRRLAPGASRARAQRGLSVAASGRHLIRQLKEPTVRRWRRGRLAPSHSEHPRLTPSGEAASVSEHHRMAGAGSRVLRFCASRPWPTAALAAVIFAVAAVTTVALTRERGPVFEPAAELGPDPFMDAPVRPVPIRFRTLKAISDAANGNKRAGRESADTPPNGADATPANDPAQPSSERPDSDRTDSPAVRAAKNRLNAIISTADRYGVPVIAPASPTGAAIYGGSNHEACDPEALIRFLNAHPQQARAWASVHGITPDEIPAYIRELNAGWLLADTPVTNHGYADGKATPREAVLEAGTAVLVDDDGVPRARCQCGNPLREVLFDLDGELVHGSAFADAVGAFALDRDRDRDRRSANPHQAVGPPDCTDESCEDDTYVALGQSRRRCEFFVTLQFVDNVLISGEGDDLRIVEIPTLEATDVFVIVDGTRRHVGRLEGGDTSIDITPVVQRGAEIREVVLCDAPDDVDTYPWPGADIDAVAALNSANQ